MRPTMRGMLLTVSQILKMKGTLTATMVGRSAERRARSSLVTAASVWNKTRSSIDAQSGLFEMRMRCFDSSLREADTFVNFMYNSLIS